MKSWQVSNKVSKDDNEKDELFQNNIYFSMFTKLIYFRVIETVDIQTNTCWSNYLAK